MNSPESRTYRLCEWTPDELPASSALFFPQAGMNEAKDAPTVWMNEITL